MNRRHFLHALGGTTAALATMKLNALLASPTTPRMPVLFFGHGNPMNAIEENEFVREFRAQAAHLPETPRAIVCVSAHWETRGTKVTAMPNPRTIHDFGGFPQALFEVQYPAPGDPGLAADVAALASSALQRHVELDHAWGLDHGTWSVVKHLFPLADVPVLQLSLDRQASASEHLALGATLAALRRRGVLIIGSGNLVHNLRAVAWDRMGEPFGYDWALEASADIQAALRSRDWRVLGAFAGLDSSVERSAAMRQAVPTPEHFLPVLYVAGLLEADEDFAFFNDRPLAGSLTMTGIRSLA